MIPCHFCSVEKKEPYKCPRCDIFYCSIKCYRNEAHASCSENFYQECVKSELKGKQHDGAPADTFDEHMAKYVRGETDQLPGTAGGTGEDEGEPLDSDDELEGQAEGGQAQEDYMQKVLRDTVDDYELDEEELERKLLAMGVGSGVEQLMSSLNDEERAAFATLAEQVYQQEAGLGDSCFRRRDN